MLEMFFTNMTPSFEFMEDQYNSKLDNERAKIKLNLKNALYSNNFCCFCLSNESLLDMTSFVDTDYGSGFVTFGQVVKDLGAELVSPNLPSKKVCTPCKSDLVVAYGIIHRSKNSLKILNSYLNQIDVQIKETEETLYDTVKPEFVNTLIMLQDPLKEEYKDNYPGSDINSNKDLYSDEMKEEMFFCSYCSKQFKWESRLNHHITMHHKSSGQCPDCEGNPCMHYDYLIKSKMVLNQKRNGKVVQCPECKYTFKNISDFIGHVNRDHLNVYPFPCNECGKDFHSRFAFLHHTKTYHSEVIVCQFCDKEFLLQEKYDSHFNDCATAMRDYQCDSCPASFIKKQQLIVHLRKHSQQYACQYCPRTYPSENCLRRHQKAHNNPINQPIYFRTRECSKCPMQFKTLGELKTHLKYDHDKSEPHVCDYCDKVFLSRKKYTAHRSHHRHMENMNKNLNTFTCEICGTVCKSAVKLEHHTNSVHLNVRPYVCQYCGKSFTAELKLKVHMYSHVEEKKYLCEYCNKRLISSSSLNKHILRVHTKEKPFQCKICSFTFVNKSELYNHTLKHSEKKVECPLCDGKFYTRSNVRSHIRKVHFKSETNSEIYQIVNQNEALSDIFRDRRIPED